MKDLFIVLGVLAIVFLLIGFIGFLFVGRVSITTQNLSGYIYSSETRFGYTTSHIRFSEQAGMDVQPSFCVKADSDAGRKVKEITGSGKKVNIVIPPYFYLTLNPFACGNTSMTIQEV